jgi:hypothetical protein
VNTDRTFSARELAKMAVAEPEREDAALVCISCRHWYTLAADLEPTPFCNLCAQGAVIQLGAEMIRIYDAIERMPPFLAAPLMEELKLGGEKARAFMADVLEQTTRKVSPTGRGRGKKKR